MQTHEHDGDGVVQNAFMAKATQEELQALHRALTRIDELVSPDGTRFWNLGSPGSALASDNDLLRPMPSSALVGHCLAMAEDQLRALRVLLTDHTGEHQFSFPMAAHNSNVRSGLECSSLAIWLLHPSDQEERLRRSLRSLVYELGHERAMYQTLTESVPEDPPAVKKKNAQQRQALMKRHQGQKRLVRDAAATAGIALDSLQPFPGFREVVGDASTALGLTASAGSGLWQVVSGLSHPSSLRQLNTADREILGEDGDNLNVMFTASTVSVIAGVLAATRHFEGALKYTQLRGQP